jgi:serine protease inhibitor
MIAARVARRAIINVFAPLLTVHVQARLKSIVTITNIIISRMTGRFSEIATSPMHSAIVHQTIVDVHKLGSGAELPV